MEWHLQKKKKKYWKFHWIICWNAAFLLEFIFHLFVHSLTVTELNVCRRLQMHFEWVHFHTHLWNNASRTTKLSVQNGTSCIAMHHECTAYTTQRHHVSQQNFRVCGEIDMSISPLWCHVGHQQLFTPSQVVPRSVLINKFNRKLTKIIIKRTVTYDCN